MAKSIAIAGKGGTGKSTLAALIIRYLVHSGMGPVLAVDADPDSNLGTYLGLKVTKTLGELREDALKEIKRLPPGLSKAHYVEAGLHQIIEEADGFDLLTMGKGEDSGCYCYLNSLIRKFSDDLLPSYSWVVMDNEAGLEHISRRTTANIDALVVVVTDNPISLNTALNIDKITLTLKNNIARKYVVTNMVKPERKTEIAQRIRNSGMSFLCDLPYDEELEESVYQGKPLKTVNNSLIEESIKTIIEKIGGTNADS